MRKNRFVLALLLTLSLAFALAGLARQTSDDPATDPVCGMTVKKSEAKTTFEYKGSTYYFCSAGCQEAFAKEPEKYLQEKAEAARAATSGMTCPLQFKDVEITAENLPDGAVVKLTSKNPETVKKMQQHLAGTKGGCGASCCQPQPNIKK